MGRAVSRPGRSRSSSWGRFLASGVSPSLAELEFVARAITPPGLHRRFDARFFMADARHARGAHRVGLGGDGELLDLRWVPVAEASALDLPTATQLVIEEVARRLAAPPGRRREIRAPFWRFRGETPLVQRR